MKEDLTHCQSIMRYIAVRSLPHLSALLKQKRMLQPQKQIQKSEKKAIWKRRKQKKEKKTEDRKQKIF